MSRFRTKPPHWHIRRAGTPVLADAPRQGALLDIVAADSLARYWLLQAPEGLASVAELDLYAADRFAAVFGDDPAGWQLRVDPVPGQTTWLACALPVSLTAELPQQAAGKGWQVRHLQPRFVREYNRHCSALKPDTVFCVATSESTTLGLIRSACWASIRVHPPLSRPGIDFATLVRRDAQQAGMVVEGLPCRAVGSLREKAK